MLEHGDLIKDGDTIDDDEAERVNVQYAVSQLTGAPVLRLSPEPTPLER